MKVSSYAMEEEEEVEAATELVKREVKKKKVVDVAALEKALAIAKEIEVPAEVWVKESSVEAAHQVIELTENLQQFVVAGSILNDVEEPHKEKVTSSEAAASGELPSFEPNLERASELASDEVTSESPQQQEPDIQMAPNTCTDLVIHPAYQPSHLNATHSNISFGISL